MAVSLLCNSSATLDWRRVGAFSTTLTAHAVALGLILMPLAAPVERSLQRVLEVTFVEAPPPAPEIPSPPEPEPLRKPPRPTVVPPLRAQPPPPEPATVAVAQAPSPVQAPAAATPAPVIAADPAPSIDPVAPAGETRRLAYDGALLARYPSASLRAREQGTVLLRVLVDAEGRVERVEVARSSGHPQLDAAAREAVSKARFKPVLQAGTPTPAWGLVPIEFRLDRA